MAAEAHWRKIRSGPTAAPQVVTAHTKNLDPLTYDVIIAGGTLGIFVAAILAQQGWRVCLLERGKFQGRVQEWNTSLQELSNLVRLHLLTDEELQSIIVSQFNPVRVAFGAEYSLWVHDVLNLGVSPKQLLERCGAKFQGWGGTLLEQIDFQALQVHPNGVVVETSQGPITGRLFIDAMGHFSPLVQQFRRGAKPEGICLVVGTCGRGFPQDNQADLMTSFTPSRSGYQYFWEAFPAQDGRTTYLFTYLDAQPERLNLVDLFEDYARLLPDYQGVALSQIQFQRALYGVFPSYEQPLVIPFDRVMPVGDAAGLQSPLSFGGFGAMLRHLPRWASQLDEALRLDQLDRNTLAVPYQPNLAVTWLFQRAMSVPLGKNPPPERINLLLQTVFSQMERLGPGILMPFLRDVVQFNGLTQTLLHTALANPRLIREIVNQVGLPALINWSGHYLALGAYTGLARLSPRPDWVWGAGLEDEIRST
jgi:lycopene cyclase CruP